MKNLQNLTTQEIIEFAENSYISGYIVSECVKTAYLDGAVMEVEKTISNTVTPIINYVASNNEISKSSTMSDRELDMLDYHMRQSYLNMISSRDNY